MSLVIKGVSPLGEKARDLYVADGVIVDEASTGSTGGGKPTVIDAEGLVALPGLVDLHTHLREPGREDAETVDTGTRCAALGGFTAVHAMANTDPVADTAGVVEQVWRLGQEAGWCDVRPVGAVTVGCGCCGTVVGIATLPSVPIDPASSVNCQSLPGGSGSGEDAATIPVSVCA